MGDNTLLEKKEEKTKVGVPTFLKWAGGKKQLLEQFDGHFPDYIENYVEPFLGGGSVLFYILKYRRPKKTHAYDVNKELINVYKQVKNNPKKLINFLKKFQEAHNNSKDPKFYYYQRRDEYNTPTRDNVKKAALFIYLNKTCFNGLYRVNSLNKFNVPFGKYDKVKIFDERTILEAAKLLKGVVLDSRSFKEINFPETSFVYFDPPYWSESNGFTSYSKSDFSEADQRELMKLFLKLHLEGHRIILSNSNTSLIRSLYRQFNVHKVDARWMINCNGGGRSRLKELLVTN